MHFAGESLNNVLKKRTAMSGATFQDARLEGDFKSKGPKPLIDLVEQRPVTLRETTGAWIRTS